MGVQNSNGCGGRRVFVGGRVLLIGERMKNLGKRRCTVRDDMVGDVGFEPTTSRV